MIRHVLVVSLALLAPCAAQAALIPVSQTLHVTASALSSGTTVTDTPPDVVLGNDPGNHSANASAAQSLAYGKATITTIVDPSINYLYVNLQTDESHPFSPTSNGNGSDSGTVSFMLDSAISWQVFTIGGPYSFGSLKLRDHVTSSVVYDGASGNQTIDLSAGQYDLQFSMQSLYAGSQGGASALTTSFTQVPRARRSRRDGGRGIPDGTPRPLAIGWLIRAARA